MKYEVYIQGELQPKSPGFYICVNRDWEQPEMCYWGYHMDPIDEAPYFEFSDGRLAHPTHFCPEMITLPWGEE
jgi:hypothetical protein